jgi:hypothetical protein
MTGFIEHYFKITVNYNAIANLHNSLGHAPFSSVYSQLLLASEFASLITTLHRPNGKHCVLLMKLVYRAVAQQWTSYCYHALKWKGIYWAVA